ncbi:MAG: ATP-binding protein [Prevotella sp.]
MKYGLVLDKWLRVATTVTIVAAMWLASTKAAAQDNPFKIPNDLYQLYQRAYDTRDSTEGLMLSDSLYSLAKKRGEMKTACLALTVNAAYYRAQKDEMQYDMAIDRLKAEARKTGLMKYFYYAYSTQAIFYLNNKHTQKALQIIKEMGNTAYRENDDFGIHSYLKAMGNLYYVYGDYVKAAECYRPAIEIHEKKLIEQDISSTYLNYAQCLDKLGYRSEAISLLEKALERVQNVNNKPNICMRLAKLLFWMQRYDEYREVFKQAEPFFDKELDKECVTNLKVLLAIADGDTAKAAAIARQHKSREYGNESMREIYIATKQFDKAYPLYVERAQSIEEGVRRNSAEHHLAQYDASVVADELNLSHLQLQFDINRHRMMKTEEEMRLDAQRRENLALKLANDSQSIARLKADSLRRNAETETLGAERARLEAESKQHGVAIGMTAAVILVVMAYAFFARKRDRREIATLKEKQRQLASALDKAQEAERLMSKFVDSLGEQVQAPMNKVVGMAEKIAGEGKTLTQDEKDRIGGDITATADRLTELLNGILSNALKESDGKARKTVTAILLALTLPCARPSLAADEEVRALLDKGYTLSALSATAKERKAALETNNQGRLFEACRMMGDVYLSRRYYRQALEAYEEAYSLLDKVNITSDVAVMLVEMARISRMNREYDDALRYIAEASQHDIARSHAEAIGRERAKIDYEAAGTELPRWVASTMNEEESLRHREVQHVWRNEWEEACIVFQTEVALHRRNIERVFENDRREMNELAGNRQLESENMKMKLLSSTMLVEQMEREGEMARFLFAKQRLADESNDLLMKRLMSEARLDRAKAERDREVTEMHRQQARLVKWAALAAALILLTVVTVMLAWLFHAHRHKRRLRHKNEELDRALRDVEKSERTKTMFIQNMSHEIRTPLNAIVGFTKLMLTQADELSEEERAEFADIVRKNSDLLTHLVADVTSLSKLGSRHYVAEMAVWNLNDLCRRTIETVRHRARPDVPLLFETNVDDSFAVNTDGHRLSEVLINFLTNAIKYTEHGTITLQCRLEGDLLTLAVADTGIGIPEDKRTEIFERFAKLDSFHQGTGLGLNICMVIAKLLHGEVGVDPDYNEGARFFIKLRSSKELKTFV